MFASQKECFNLAHNSFRRKYLTKAGVLVLTSVMLCVSAFAVAEAAAEPDESIALPGAEITENKIYDYLSNDGEFHVLSAYEVTVNDGDDTCKLLAQSGDTVSRLLREAHISLGKNQISVPGADAEITGDTEIRVYDAKQVSVNADGETKKMMLPEVTVEEALTLAGVELGREDILSVKRTDSVKETDAVTIKRVTYREETVSESVPYEKVKENSDEVELGKTKIKTEGSVGEKAILKRVKYIDGKRDSSETVTEKIVKKPVDEVTLVGTKGASEAGGAGTFTDENGVKVPYRYKLTGSGTAYTAPAGALTATGNAVQEGCVAINPSLIPYGSKVYVEATDGSRVYGYATATDTGGALMDGSAVVDVFYFSYDACCNWGRRDVNVYVLS